MFGKLKNLFGAGDRSPAGPGAEALAPEAPLYVVGDIHGRADLLNRALKLIEEHRDACSGSAKTVFVGDYIDRGPESAKVLETLYKMQQGDPDRIICLKGNHESMLLEFVDDPAERGGRWLINGGSETLDSYGIGGLHPKSDAEDMMEAGDAMAAAMPEGLMNWLRALPLTYRSGNVIVTHAAMDPDLAPEDQSDKVLLWGHREFLTRPREDELWVAHGHTIMKQAHCHSSRIAVDTGAYRTETLTVAAIRQGGCEFLQTK